MRPCHFLRSITESGGNAVPFTNYLQNTFTDVIIYYLNICYKNVNLVDCTRRCTRIYIYIILYGYYTRRRRRRRRILDPNTVFAADPVSEARDHFRRHTSSPSFYDVFIISTWKYRYKSAHPSRDDSRKSNSHNMRTYV